MEILLLIIGALIVLFAQLNININYSKYKKIKNNNNLTGADAARLILENNDLSNIYVIETSGNLTDHYDPSKKVIKLSEEIYNGTTIAAISVAAHECGHAIQDKDGYTFMRIRSILVPVVNLVSYLGYFGIIISIFAGLTAYIKLCIIVLLSTVIFQLITLPVEFDASGKATKELRRLNIADNNEIKKCKKMLFSAALTYVASLLSTLLQLLRLILILRGRDD